MITGMQSRDEEIWRAIDWEARFGCPEGAGYLSPRRSTCCSSGASGRFLSSGATSPNREEPLGGLPLLARWRGGAAHGQQGGGHQAAEGDREPHERTRCIASVQRSRPRPLHSTARLSLTSVQLAPVQDHATYADPRRYAAGMRASLVVQGDDLSVQYCGPVSSAAIELFARHVAESMMPRAHGRSTRAHARRLQCRRRGRGRARCRPAVPGIMSCGDRPAITPRRSEPAVRPWSALARGAPKGTVTATTRRGVQVRAEKLDRAHRAAGDAAILGTVVALMRRVKPVGVFGGKEAWNQPVGALIVIAGIALSQGRVPSRRHARRFGTCCGAAASRSV